MPPWSELILQLRRQTLTGPDELCIGHHLGEEVCWILLAWYLGNLDLLLVPDALNPLLPDVDMLPLFRANPIAASASTNTGSTLDVCSISSSAMYCICKPLITPVESALLSASAELVAMQSCLDDSQSTGTPLYLISMPDLDLVQPSIE